MNYLAYLQTVINNFQISSENVIFLIIFFIFWLGFKTYFDFKAIPQFILIFYFFTISYVLFRLSNIKFNFPIRGGISKANFHGESSWNTPVLLFTYIVFVISTVVVLLILKRRFSNTVIHDPHLNSKIENLRYFYFITIAISSVLIMPDIKSFSSLTANWSANGNNWDVQNLATWDELYIYGFLPMKDFWYPYGNLIFTEAFPSTGRLLLWIFQLSFIVISTFLISNIAIKNKILLVVSSQVVFVYLLQNDFWGIVRYGLPAITGGLIAFYLFNRGFKQSNYWIVQVALVFVPWVGGSIYVVLTTSCILGITLFIYNEVRIVLTDSRINGSDKIKKFYSIPRLIINNNTTPFISSWLVYTIYAFSNGQLVSEWDGLRNSTNVLEKSSYPMSLAADFIDRPGLFSVVFFAMIIILAISLINFIFDKKRSSETMNFGVLFIVVFAGIGALYKWSFRGDLVDTRSIAIISILIFITIILNIFQIEFRLDKLRTIQYALIILVTITTFSLRQEVPTRIYNFVNNLNFATIDTISQEKEKLRIRQTKFSDFSEVPYIYSVRDFLNDNNLFPFYSPTDFGYLNALTKQKPYFYISSYDSSTKLDNLKLIKLLSENHPKAIIVNETKISFDSVHLNFRHPILLKWIIDNYELKTTIGNYFIFTQKFNSFDSNLPGWVKLMGITDLGNIPYFISEDRNCGAEEDCQVYLKIKLLKEDEFCNLTIETRGVKTKFFFPIKYDVDYALIPFSRLWSVSETSSISDISCSNQYVLFKNNLENRLF
jgi:hypothetical protein